MDSDGRTRRANEGIVNMNVSKNSGCLLGLACWNLHRATAEQRSVRQGCGELRRVDGNGGAVEVQ